MYNLLSQSFKEQETRLTELVTEAVPAEKVYLLGCTIVQQRTESIFCYDAPTGGL